MDHPVAGSYLDPTHDSVLAPVSIVSISRDFKNHNSVLAPVASVHLEISSPHHSVLAPVLVSP